MPPKTKDFSDRMKDGKLTGGAPVALGQKIPPELRPPSTEAPEAAADAG